MDAASGGFIAPFLYPELEWDFRLPLVKSINVSGHKYGLVYAGIGWVIWRTKEDLPEELIFHINYLGADQPTFTLNFSKGNLLNFSFSYCLSLFFLLVLIFLFYLVKVISFCSAFTSHDLSRRTFKLIKVNFISILMCGKVT